MTPLRFEEQYEGEWTELEALLDRATFRQLGREVPDNVPGVRLAALYRRSCEHLALARARAYPAHLVDRLERMTSRAHQLIYQRRELEWQGARHLVFQAFPDAVRRHWTYAATAASVFLIPMLVMGLLVYWRSDLVLSLVSAEQASTMEDMYSQSAQVIGRSRRASTDWIMFGYYIRNNVGVAFQCFAGGLFFGVGSLFFLAYNGAFIGALAGYLTERGLGSTFYAFVATHSAFELTAIVLSGAAGLRIGHALVAPGRRRRGDALVHATRESAVILYGVTALLVIAAAVEAFWSSAAWLPAAAKYGAAAVSWAAVLGYFVRQGRRAD